MFVRRTTHAQLQRRYDQAIADVMVSEARRSHLQAMNQELQAKHQKLLNDWNALVAKVNARGGLAFLHAPMPIVASPFTRDDIRRLLSLVHPDKHDGKIAAHEMTQVLLKLRDQLPS